MEKVCFEWTVELALKAISKIIKNKVKEHFGINKET